MPSAAFEPLNDLLQQPLSNVVAERLNEKLVALHASSTVEEAFRVLSKNQIISAPVVKPAKDNQRLEWIGFVSYRNLIRFFGQFTDRDDFLDSKLEKVVQFSKTSPLQVENRSKIANAVEFFGSLGGLHRCGVYNSQSGKVKRAICSQSDIVRYISKHLYDNEELQRFSAVPISEVGWGKRHPISIQHDQTVLQALTSLIQKRVGCLAVIDRKSGALVGNFSGSDLRGLGSELLDYLRQPVREFLAKHSPGSLIPQTESVTQSIGVLISRLVKQNLHHIWLEDTDGKPEGLITLTDIMNVLLKFSPSDNSQATVSECAKTE